MVSVYLEPDPFASSIIPQSNHFSCWVPILPTYRSGTAIAIWFGVVILIMAAEKAFPRTGDDGSRISILSSAPGANLPVGGDGQGGIGGGGARLADLDFAELAEETFGRYGATSVNVSIVIGNFGDVCSYVVLVGSLASSLLDEWFGGDENTDDDSGDSAWWSSFSVVTPIMVALFVFPPCLIRHFSNLR